MGSYIIMHNTKDCFNETKVEEYFRCVLLLTDLKGALLPLAILLAGITIAGFTKELVLAFPPERHIFARTTAYLGGDMKFSPTSK